MQTREKLSIKTVREILKGKTAPTLQGSQRTFQRRGTAQTNSQRQGRSFQVC